MLGGREKRFATRDGFAAGVVLTVPPYPYDDLPGADCKGLPVLFRAPLSAEEQDRLHHGEVALRAGQLVTAGTMGYVTVATGTGPDLAAARRFYADFGLSEAAAAADRSDFRTLDGTEIRLRRADDPALPPAVVDGPTVREIVWGVDGEPTLRRIADELAKDRDVAFDADGVLHCRDDDGYGIAFRIDRRDAYVPPAPRLNLYGAPPARPVTAPPMMAPEAAPIAVPRSVSLQAARVREDAARQIATIVFFMVPAPGCLTGSDASHEDEDENDDDDEAEPAGRAVTPAPAVSPVRQGADQEEDENDEKNGAEHLRFLSRPVRS